MTDETKNEACFDEVTPEAAAPEGKESKKKQRRLEAELLELNEKLAKMQEELAAAEDKYLRLAAEYDNFRKRTAKERENLFADVYADALAVFLPVLDNLERAAAYGDGESVAKGVSMTLKSINDALEKLGVTEIEAEGQPFDPNLHNAVLHVEDESLGEGVVAEVLQKGYRKGERILRYAMVKVAN
jgi:molecular chaperone GrpE